MIRMGKTWRQKKGLRLLKAYSHETLLRVNKPHFTEKYKTNQFVKAISTRGFSHLQLTATDSLGDTFEHSEKRGDAAHSEKHLADTHQGNSDKIVRDCVEGCVRARACTHISTRARKSALTWASACTVFVCTRAAICVYVLVMWWLTAGGL